jgi:hypothetical protein
MYKAAWGSGGKARHILNLGTRYRVFGSTLRPFLFADKRHRYSLVGRMGLVHFTTSSSSVYEHYLPSNHNRIASM